MRLRVSHGIGLALLLTSGAVAWRALSAEPPRAVPPPPAAAAPEINPPIQPAIALNRGFTLPL